MPTLEQHPNIKPMSREAKVFAGAGGLTLLTGLVPFLVRLGSDIPLGHDELQVYEGLIAGGGFVFIVAMIYGLMMRAQDRS